MLHCNLSLPSAWCYIVSVPVGLHVGSGCSVSLCLKTSPWRPVLHVNVKSDTAGFWPSRRSCNNWIQHEMSECISFLTNLRSLYQWIPPLTHFVCYHCCMIVLVSQQRQYQVCIPASPKHRPIVFVTVDKFWWSSQCICDDVELASCFYRRTVVPKPYFHVKEFTNWH